MLCEPQITSYFIFNLGFFFCILSHGLPVPDNSKDVLLKAVSFLGKYGYLNTQSNDFSRASLRASATVDKTESFIRAVKDFQTRFHLNVTGEIDEETLALINSPRCGVSDVISARNNTRNKRYVIYAYKWSTNKLTYTFSNYSKDIPKDQIDSTIDKALALWSSAANLDFIRVPSDMTGIMVNIEMGFFTGYHGDNDPFDGPGGTLAHAYFPPYGDLHFDDAENFTVNSLNGTNLLTVAAHELGHSLGLEHTYVQGAVMFPFYQPYNPDVEFTLQPDDIAGIQFLYGARDGYRGGMPSTLNPDMSTTPYQWRYPGDIICTADYIDAMYHNQAHDLTYVFKDQYYWVMDYEGVQPGYPRYIQSTWPALPTHVDAALYWPTDIVFIFKGASVYRITNNVVTKESLISSIFPGLPSSIDSAFTVHGDENTYFTVGNEYYFTKTYKFEVKKGSVSVREKWRASEIQAAVNYNYNTYFFLGRLYFQVLPGGEIPNGYPRSMASSWFGCSGDIPREYERHRSLGCFTTPQPILYLIMFLILIYL